MEKKIRSYLFMFFLFKIDHISMFFYTYLVGVYPKEKGGKWGKRKTKFTWLVLVGITDLEILVTNW